MNVPPPDALIVVDAHNGGLTPTINRHQEERHQQEKHHQHSQPPRLSVGYNCRHSLLCDRQESVQTTVSHGEPQSPRHRESSSRALKFGQKGTIVGRQRQRWEEEYFLEVDDGMHQPKRFQVIPPPSLSIVNDFFFPLERFYAV